MKVKDALDAAYSILQTLDHINFKIGNKTKKRFVKIIASNRSTSKKNIEAVILDHPNLDNLIVKHLDSGFKKVKEIAEHHGATQTLRQYIVEVDNTIQRARRSSSGHTIRRIYDAIITHGKLARMVSASMGEIILKVLFEILDERDSRYQELRSQINAGLHKNGTRVVTGREVDYLDLDHHREWASAGWLMKSDMNTYAPNVSLAQ